MTRRSASGNLGVTHLQPVLGQSTEYRAIVSVDHYRSSWAEISGRPMPEVGCDNGEHWMSFCSARRDYWIILIMNNNLVIFAKLYWSKYICT